MGVQSYIGFPRYNQLPGPLPGTGARYTFLISLLWNGKYVDCRTEYWACRAKCMPRPFHKHNLKINKTNAGLWRDEGYEMGLKMETRLANNILWRLSHTPTAAFLKIPVQKVCCCREGRYYERESSHER